MGQFSVEICHLVGQFSMKLNSVRVVSSRRRTNSHPHGHSPRGALRPLTSSSFQPRPGSDGCLLCSSRLSSPQHFEVGVDQVLTTPKTPMAACAAIVINT